MQLALLAAGVSESAAHFWTGLGFETGFGPDGNNIFPSVTVDKSAVDFSKFDNLQIPKISGDLAKYAGRFVDSVACGDSVARLGKTTSQHLDNKAALLAAVANCDDDKITLNIIQWLKKNFLKKKSGMKRDANFG